LSELTLIIDKNYGIRVQYPHPVKVSHLANN